MCPTWGLLDWWSPLESPEGWPVKLPDQVCLEIPALLGFPHLEVLRYYAGISRPSALRLLMNLMTSDPGGPCTQEGPWSSGFLFLFICLFVF